MIGELAFVVSSASQLTKVIDMARNNIDNFAFISFRIKYFCNKRKYGYFIALLELCNHQISIAYISKQHIYILILGTIIYVRLLSILSFNILAVILYNPTKIAHDLSALILQSIEREKKDALQRCTLYSHNPFNLNIYSIDNCFYRQCAIVVHWDLLHCQLQRQFFLS